MNLRRHGSSDKNYTNLDSPAARVAIEGDSMKRVAMIGAVLALATGSFAQTRPPATQNAPAAQPGSAPTAPQGKRPPAAKTTPEYEAYKTAAALTDPAAAEKATEDFATKFPDSELRIVLFKDVMRSYQRAGNSDKIMEMGRKALAIDGDDPEALVTVAGELAEKTRDTDLDKDQRLDEAMKMAQKAGETVDTDIAIPQNTPQEQIDAYKAQLRSFAYSIIGTLEFKKDNFAGAETDLRKSIDAYPSQPDPVVVLRLAISLDRQNKYADALKEATHAVDLTQESTGAGKLARQERDRLMQLVGGPGTAPPK
jgi:tetratricopeptide (TPR) repeat protein